MLTTIKALQAPLDATTLTDATAIENDEVAYIQLAIYDGNGDDKISMNEYWMYSWPYINPVENEV